MEQLYTRQGHVRIIAIFIWIFYIFTLVLIIGLKHFFLLLQPSLTPNIWFLTVLNFQTFKFLDWGPSGLPIFILISSLQQSLPSILFSPLSLDDILHNNFYLYIWLSFTVLRVKNSISLSLPQTHTHTQTYIYMFLNSWKGGFLIQAAIFLKKNFFK